VKRNKLSTSLRRILLLSLTLIGLVTGLAAWSLSSPVGASPDDDFHLTSIWCGGGQKPGLCEDSTAQDHRKVLPGLLNSACYAFEPSISAGCQAANQTFSSTELTDTTRGSFIGNYPPVYYWVMSNFVSSNIPLSTLTVRLINVAFFIASLVSLLLLAPRGLRRTIYWVWTLSLVPLGMFLIASINPSSWAITAVVSSWFALFIFFTSRGMRMWIAAGLFLLEVFLASGARADAAIYTIIASLSVLGIIWTRSHKNFVKLLLPIVGSVISLYFYFGSLQATVATSGMLTSDGATARSALGVLSVNLVQLPSLWVGAFGYWPLGWLDTVMPPAVWVFTFSAFVAIIFTSLRRTPLRRSLTLVALAAILYFLPIYVLQKGLNYVGEQVQPRYLLPLIIVFAAVALLGHVNSSEILSTKAAFIVITGFALANSLALFINTKRYVSGLNVDSGVSLDSRIDWWWSTCVSPMTVWVIGSLGFTVAIIFGYHFLVSSSRNETTLLTLSRSSEPLPLS
jgi:hypothetical protein